MRNRLFTKASTRKHENYNIMKIGVDSVNKFREGVDGDVVAPECSFRSYFETPIKITGYTEVYLQSIWIGGYKINQSRAVTWDDEVTPLNDVISYFSIRIPQFNVDSLASEFSDTYDVCGNRILSDNMNRRFNLVNETPNTLADKTYRPSIKMRIDYKPFTLGTLNKRSLFVSKIEPQTLSYIDIDIKDQDGDNIWMGGPIRETDINGINTGPVYSNPPILSRRVMMEFVFLEKLD